MKPLKLSICISSLRARVQTLHELQVCLSTQERLDEVEILIAVDDGQDTIGSKRNRLVKAARGEYIVHIDDDDLVHSDYTRDILAAIDASLGVDAVAIRGRRTEKGYPKSYCLFDYRLVGLEGEWVDGVLWRSPGHICPIRASLCRLVPFTNVREAEDLIWNQAVAPHLKTIARAGDPLKELYLYRWDPKRAPYV